MSIEGSGQRTPREKPNGAPTDAKEESAVHPNPIGVHRNGSTGSQQQHPPRK
jgi:hypothetical protein